MPRLRTLTPWLLAALAVAAALAPHVPKDIFTLRRVALTLAAVAVALAVTLLLRRRRARPKPPRDPHAAAARLTRRAFTRDLEAACRALGGPPARTWLVLGPPQHGKTTLVTAVLGPLRDVTTSTLATPRCLVAADTRTLVLEHPTGACDLRPLLRLRRPLDAILLVLALPDLESPSDLRTHLHHIQQTLSVDVPIHLVVTKLDRLAGHAELTHTDATPWALTLATPSHLPAALRTWTRWVDAQRLARLAVEPAPDRRARLHTFAAAFTHACDRLAELFTTADPLRLRTVFFTAARPDTTPPTDRVLHNLATQLHLPLRDPPTKPASPSAITPLPTLRTALQAHDREAARSPHHHRRIHRRTLAAAAVLTLAATTLTVTAPTAATNHHTCQQSLADLTAPLVPSATEPTTPAQLAALIALHTTLTDPAACTPPDLAVPWRRLVRKHLLHDLWSSLEQNLRRHAEAPPTTVADQVAARDRLRAYLLLTADLSETPGPFDPVQKTWLTHDLANRWSLDVRQGPHDLTPTLTTFFTLATPTDLALPRDHELIKQVRERLGAHNDDDATLHAALAFADASCEPLALRNLTHAAHLIADSTLPCSFTRPGWPLVQQQLAAAVDRHDGWILGRPAGEPRDQRLARLRDRYDARYIQAWTEFLAGIRVRRPTDQASASRLLSELTDGDPPLARVFAGLDHHTRGLGRTRADVPAWLPDTPTTPAQIHQAFAPLLAFTVATDREPGLARWHARLAEVLAALEAARNDPAALPALRTHIAGALADTQTLLRHADVRRFRPLLTTLLLPPLEALQAAVTDQDKLALVRTYCHELHAPLHRIARRYPFAPAAADDASLADFTALFHPDTGAISRLRDGALAPFLTGHAADLTVKPAPRSDPHPLHPRVAAMLRRAATVSRLAFPKAQLGLTVDVDLRCNADIGRVSLTIGPAHHTYACGPNPRATLHWPGEPPTDGANLELLGRDGRRQQLPGHGPWGLFRLLEKDGLVTPPSDATQGPLVFHLDLRATRLGALDLALTPARTDGATLLFGPGDTGPALLAPLRTHDLQDPPAVLFQGLPACTDLEP